MLDTKEFPDKAGLLAPTYSGFHSGQHVVIYKLDPNHPRARDFGAVAQAPFVVTEGGACKWAVWVGEGHYFDGADTREELETALRRAFDHHAAHWHALEYVADEGSSAP